MRRVAVMLDGEPAAVQTTLLSALSSGEAISSLVPLRCATLAELLRARPDIVLVGRSRLSGARSAAYRMMRRRSRLLAWSAEPPRPADFSRRLLLRFADGVLSGGVTPLPDGPEQAQAGRARRFHAPGPFDLATFLDAPAERDLAVAHRIVVRDALAMDGTALDILSAVVLAAERRPRTDVRLCWLGDGVLRGVLEAQPLPANLTQTFSGPMDRASLRATYLGQGILVASGHDDRLAAAEAMASGLVVLFGRDSRRVRALHQEGRTGLAFDPARPDSLAATLDGLLAAAPGELDLLRLAARRQVLPMDEAGFAERVAHAVQAMLRDWPQDTQAGAAPLPHAVGAD